jgi:hypothetical protein
MPLRLELERLVNAGALLSVALLAGCEQGMPGQILRTWDTWRLN